jgi:hypothetical protein
MGNEILIECLPARIVTEDLDAGQNLWSLSVLTYLEVFFKYVKFVIVMENVLNCQFVKDFD